jgi:hypothetical protein
MNKIKTFLLPILVCLMLVTLWIGPQRSTMAAPNAPQVTQLLVDTTLDSFAPAQQVCSPAANDCSLRGAIFLANAYSSSEYEIIVPEGIYTLTLPGANEDVNATGDLDINTSVRLTGAGAKKTIIQAGTSAGTGIDRVLHVNNSSGRDVFITDLTLRFGLLDDHGGGLYAGASGEDWIILERVVVEQNTSLNDHSGGGIFVVTNMKLRDSTVRNNEGYEGGGIYTVSSPTLEVEDSTIHNNHARYHGGGIMINSVVNLTNVTISGNTAAASGGGASMWNSGNGTFVNVTMANNSVLDPAVTTGWAIYNKRQLHVKNSLFSAPVGKTACSNGVSDSVNSMSGDSSCGVNFPNYNLMLGPMQNNGGDTLTHALLAGSPAIDGGDASVCPEHDQRGVRRPIDGDGNGSAACDIGAFEREVFLFLPLTIRH